MGSFSAKQTEEVANIKQHSKVVIVKVAAFGLFPTLLGPETRMLLLENACPLLHLENV